MDKITIMLILVGMSTGIMAQSGNLSDYRWQNRLVLLFGNEDDHGIEKQCSELKRDPEGLTERDIKVFRITESQVTDLEGTLIPGISAELIRENYLNEEEGFRYILIGKDGGVKMNSGEFVPNELLFGKIDAMPMRRREMRQQQKNK